MKIRSTVGINLVYKKKVDTYELSLIIDLVIL